MSKIINKEGLVEFLQTQNIFADATKKDTKEFVEDFFGFIAQAVAEGDTVKIAGIGKFTPFTLANGKRVPKFYAYEDFQNLVSAA